MHKRLFPIFLLLFAINAFAQNVIPSKWDDGKPFDWFISMNDTRKLEMEKKWIEIGEDNAAKTYALNGYEAGYFLRYSPSKGFIFVPYLDQRTIVDFNYGDVKLGKDSEIILAPKEERLEDWVHGITPTIWIPTLDGRFLIPKKELSDFFDFYAGRGKFQGYPRFENDIDSRRFPKQTGISNTIEIQEIIADKYSSFIKKPFEGKIISVGKSKNALSKWANSGQFEELSQITPVKIDLGRVHKLKTGKLFFLRNSGSNTDQILRVISVGKTTSNAIVYRRLSKDGKAAYDGKWDEKTGESEQIPFPKLTVGTRITTSALIAFD